MLDYDNRYTSDIVSINDYYYEKMHEYAMEAMTAFTKYDLCLWIEICDCVAIQFTEEHDSAKKIWNKLGLREVHAWAVQANIKAFIASYEETEVYDYDV